MAIEGEIMKIRISLGMVIVMKKIVTVEVPDDFHSWEYFKKHELMADVYEVDEGDGFTEDDDCGVEEGEHGLLGEATGDALVNEPDYRAEEETSPTGVKWIVPHKVYKPLRCKRCHGLVVEKDNGTAYFTAVHLDSEHKCLYSLLGEDEVE